MSGWSNLRSRMERRAEGWNVQRCEGVEVGKLKSLKVGAGWGLVATDKAEL